MVLNGVKRAVKRTPIIVIAFVAGYILATAAWGVLAAVIGIWIQNLGVTVLMSSLAPAVGIVAGAYLAVEAVD